MTWPGGIGEFEGLYLVLEDVGERDDTTLVDLKGANCSRCSLSHGHFRETRTSPSGVSR